MLTNPSTVMLTLAEKSLLGELVETLRACEEEIDCQHAVMTEAANDLNIAIDKYNALLNEIETVNQRMAEWGLDTARLEPVDTPTDVLCYSAADDLEGLLA